MPPDDDRQQRVEQLVADYLARRERGEPVSSEQMLSQHADLMPELSRELDRRLAALNPAEIAKATETRAMVPAELAGGVKDTQGFFSVRAASRPLKIRCPLCRHAFEIPTDGELHAQECPACHKRFSLAGWEPQAASNRGAADRRRRPALHRGRRRGYFKPPRRTRSCARDPGGRVVRQHSHYRREIGRAHV